MPLCGDRYVYRNDPKIKAEVRGVSEHFITVMLDGQPSDFSPTTFRNLFQAEGST